MHLSVIIPAKNEERFIASTVTSVYEYLMARHIEHEILVVTNRSTDKTGEIVNQLCVSTVPTVRLLDYPNNGGKGFAVREGMLQAKGDFRLFMDADNSTSINHIEKMMPYFDQGYGVVIGSIAVKGKKVAKGSEPFWRIMFGKMGNIFIQIMAVPGIHDTQRGFKIVTAKVAQDIFSRITILHWGFDVEMLALARKFGYKIKEVPVDWHNDPNSRVGLKTYFEVLLETVKVRWNLITGKYNQRLTIND
ncbi:MAG: dolichyl-phosphate beta-glucosyltransferase [Patescibacteria group bacterium]